MKFVYVKSGRDLDRYLPVSDIKEMCRDDERKSPRYFVKLKDGEEYDLYADTYNALTDPVHTYIPAQPGWCLIDQCDAGELEREIVADSFCLTPIIAWGFTNDGETKPITASGSHKLEGTHWISTPDGTILHPECREYTNFDEFVAHREELRKEELAKVRSQPPVRNAKPKAANAPV